MVEKPDWAWSGGVARNTAKALEEYRYKLGVTARQANRQFDREAPLAWRRGWRAEHERIEGIDRERERAIEQRKIDRLNENARYWRWRKQLAHRSHERHGSVGALRDQNGDATGP